MLSVTQFRTHLLPLFRIMKDTGQVFEVVYKGTVYDLHVRRTNKDPKLTRRKFPKRHELVPITVDECPECGSIMMAGVCMNSDCSASSIPSQSETNQDQ